MDNDIKRIVKEAIKESLEERCLTQCPVTPEMANNMGHFFGMIKDVGDGDTRKGVEEVREGMRLIRCYKKIQKNISAWVSKTIVVTILSAFLFLLWIGFRQVLGR
jgi:uncharacterized protein YlaN (UPF0358 family)